MYSTCLFCNGPLGRNEAIEAFPVGRRLAYDPARGRLWVVCTHCERWNLTPLEERWEAIEEAERAFRETRLRVSTDQVGLARLREGLELVRIGAPQRPELAAWRYGDQFGRRRRRALVYGGAIAVTVGAIAIAGPMMGLISGGSMGVINFWNLGRTIYRSRSIAARLPAADGGILVVQRDQLDLAAVHWDSAVDRWSLDITHRRTGSATTPWWHFDNQRATTNLTGDEALRAARALLPGVNASGAGARVVSDAVQYLEAAPEPQSLFAQAARAHTTRARFSSAEQKVLLKAIPAHVRLALEMSAHEESERHALEGELHLLEAAWRDAEEIAGIADDMFLPESMDEELRRLKEGRRE
jgi:hypothetical protein